MDTPRSKDSLRKFYENMKRTVRKDVANERYETIKTGGGPRVHSTDATKDLVLNLVNKKTVYYIEKQVPCLL